MPQCVLQKAPKVEGQHIVAYDFLVDGLAFAQIWKLNSARGPTGTHWSIALTSGKPHTLGQFTAPSKAADALKKMIGAA